MPAPVQSQLAHYAQNIHSSFQTQLIAAGGGGYKAAGAANSSTVNHKAHGYSMP